MRKISKVTIIVYFLFLLNIPSYGLDNVGNYFIEGVRSDGKFIAFLRMQPVSFEGGYENSIPHIAYAKIECTEKNTSIMYFNFGKELSTSRQIPGTTKLETYRTPRSFEIRYSRDGEFYNLQGEIHRAYIENQQTSVVYITEDVIEILDNFYNGDLVTVVVDAPVGRYRQNLNEPLMMHFTLDDEFKNSINHYRDRCVL